MTIRPTLFCLSLQLLLGCASAQARRDPAVPPVSSADTIDIRVQEGTTLGLDLSRDGLTLVFDLLGQLWLVPAQGGEARPVTGAVRDAAEDLDPSFSPEGRRILFRGERGGRRGMWLLELDSERPRQLTQLPDPDAWEGQGAWAPDGSSVAFARVFPAVSGDEVQWRSDIELLDLATGQVGALRIGGLPSPDVRDPVWSPGGEWIGFVAGEATSSEGGRVWRVPASGGQATPLTPEGVLALGPAFAPDGHRVAFFAPDSAGRLQVWVQALSRFSAPSDRPIQLTNHADVAPTRVRWSPGGEALLYSAEGRLWRIPAAGGPAAEIPFDARLTIARERPALRPVRFPAPGEVQEARGHMGLALSPDGGRVGLLALGKLWVVPVGGAPYAVADVPRTAHGLAWSADGAEVAWAAGPWEEEDLFATSLETGATRQITALPDREILPAYSPDGQHLAFVHGQGPYQLRVVDAGASSVGDIAETRELGALSIPWVGTAAYAPKWSPDSDALLVWAEPQTYRSDRAEMVTLAGERHTVPRFPDAPIFLQWTNEGSIVFVRHDRLWRAAFDHRGMLGEPEPLGADPALYASAARDGTVLYISKGGLRLRPPSGAERRLGWPLRYTPPTPEPLLIRNVRIIDGTGAPPTVPQDVLIRRGRIEQIAAAGRLDGNGRTRVMDAGGRTAIPGLMDLHMHVYSLDLLPGLLYFGVTTIRDQGSPMAPLVGHAEAVAANVFPGPRVSYGGFQFFSDWAFDNEEWRGVEPEADEGHLRRSVALAGVFGAHHIKTRTFRRWDLNARFVEEAHLLGMRVTGHCAHPLPLVAMGIDAKEHFGQCALRGDAYMYADLVELFRAAGIAVVPTISYFAFAARLNERPELLDDAELAPFLPPTSSFEWMLALSPEARAELARDAERSRQATARLRRAGVTIGTGTDIWQVPAAVHMELEELVDSGFSPLEAIHAATGASARVLGAEAELGTIQVGKWADLVILDADPLADIRNTRRIWSVVQGGRIVDRGAILELLRRR